MKVYFSATITEDTNTKDHYSDLIRILTAAGHKVYEYGSHKLNPENLINRSDTEIKEAYSQLNKYLKNSDVYIAEISKPSVGIGYEISQAIAMKKPALVLCHKDSSFQPLATIEGNKSKYLRFEIYEEKNLEEIVNKFMKEAKQKVDTKFILIISPEIDRYLEWASENRRMHKAQVVRSAIEDLIEQDKEYQEYLK